MSDPDFDRAVLLAERRAGKSLLRPAMKAQDPSVTLDENNLVIEPRYIPSGHVRIDINFENYIGPAILTLQRELDRKLLRSYGVINTGGA